MAAHEIHHRIQIGLIFCEISDMPGHTVCDGPLGQPLSAPVNRHGAKATCRQIARRTAIFLNVFCSPWQQQDSALGRIRCPDGHPDAHTVSRRQPIGAAIRRAQGGYDADETTTQMRRSKALFTSGFFAARAGAGADTSDATPIFVIGLPRSGSTLVEQILASHSAVEGTMELPDIGHLARDLDRADARYPLGLSELAAADFKALGETFLARTQVHRKLGRPFFVDKMPNNFQHLGLIALALPGARILDVRRHPLGCGFSAFKQHFAQGQAFSYDLTDLGRYYADYVELMGHMQGVLPGRVHRVIYEDLVADTEVQVRRLLAHCGLPFEPACLDFHRNDRAVRTVSSEQVRRPIFHEGVDQWRRFEPWLDPLKAALGDAMTNWRS